MKSRICFTPLAVPFLPGHRSHHPTRAGKRIDVTRVRRQRRLLLGVSILLIFCWTIGAIWLISVRQGERSTAEVLARQGVIASHYHGGMTGSR